MLKKQNTHTHKQTKMTTKNMSFMNKLGFDSEKTVNGGQQKKKNCEWTGKLTAVVCTNEILPLLSINTVK